MSCYVQINMMYISYYLLVVTYLITMLQVLIIFIVIRALVRKNGKITLMIIFWPMCGALTWHFGS